MHFALCLISFWHFIYLHKLFLSPCLKIKLILSLCWNFTEHRSELTFLRICTWFASVHPSWLACVRPLTTLAWVHEAYHLKINIYCLREQTLIIKRTRTGTEGLLDLYLGPYMFYNECYVMKFYFKELNLFNLEIETHTSGHERPHSSTSPPLPVLSRPALFRARP